ncbi:MAG: hypothetical protein DMG57_44705 [Acidobacteria bacterium]|nr:MAG: hypothetical protein DMG57_44705 [Acidobacteriota bacterium]
MADLISLLFTTYGVSAAAGVPVISQILNNSSLIPPLFPNYGIAPSSIFVVRESSLSGPGTPSAPIQRGARYPVDAERSQHHRGGLNCNQVSPAHGLRAGLVALIQSSTPLRLATVL